jgi:hypothetical protein
VEGVTEPEGDVLEIDLPRIEAERSERVPGAQR